MITLEHFAAMAEALPETTVEQRYGRTAWAVAGKAFAWERPFSKADLRRFGDAEPPSEPIVAVRVADLNDKAALLAAGAPGFFTIDHFEGYPAVLVHLAAAEEPPLREALLDAWSACAPAKIAARHYPAADQPPQR